MKQYVHVVIENFQPMYLSKCMRANIEKQLEINVKKVFSSMFTSFDTSGRIAQLDGNGTFITWIVRSPGCICN
jgi:hypothetical protein